MPNFRGFVTAVMSTGTVTDTWGTIVAANADRKYLYLSNAGAGTAFVGLGGSIAVNQGIKINSAGSADCSWEMSAKRGNIYTGVVTAVNASGTTLLAILEGD